MGGDDPQLAVLETFAIILTFASDIVTNIEEASPSNIIKQIINDL